MKLPRRLISSDRLPQANKSPVPRARTCGWRLTTSRATSQERAMLTCAGSSAAPTDQRSGSGGLATIDARVH